MLPELAQGRLRLRTVLALLVGFALVFATTEVMAQIPTLSPSPSPSPPAPTPQPSTRPIKFPLTEYSVPNPGLITASSDGHLWYVQGSNVVRVTTSGKVVASYPIPEQSFIYDLGGIVGGQDGSLWLTRSGYRFTVRGGVDQEKSEVIRFSREGKVSLYKTPHPGQSLGRITFASDANLWFTSGNPNPGVFRLTPEGDLRFFSCGDDCRLAADIVESGSLMHFSVVKQLSGDQYQAGIAQMTLAGEIRKVDPIAERGAEGSGTRTAYQLVADRSGTIWFLDRFDARIRINKLDPDGQVTSFPLDGCDAHCDPNAHVGKATLGPDGAIWITDNYDKDRKLDDIRRFLLDGTIEVGRPPSHGNNPFVYAATAGPDGNLWFTQPGYGLLGKYTLATAKRASPRVTATPPQPSFTDATEDPTVTPSLATKSRPPFVPEKDDSYLIIVALALAMLAGAGSLIFVISGRRED